MNQRTFVLGGSGAQRVIHDGSYRQTGVGIGGFLDGNAIFEILEGDATAHLGDNRVGVRIPTGEQLSLFDFVAVLDAKRCTVGHFVALTFVAVLVNDRQFARAGNRD